MNLEIAVEFRELYGVLDVTRKKNHTRRSELFQELTEIRS
jgi:hypothetical protein